VNKDQFKILSETLEGISSNPYSEVSEDVIAEDEIDGEKLKVIGDMRKALGSFDQSIFKLGTLDKMKGSSGLADLQDQLVTMDKLVANMYAVLDRAAGVVPPNSGSNDDDEDLGIMAAMAGNM